MTIEHVMGVLGGLLMLLGAWWIATPSLALAAYANLYRRPLHLTVQQLRIHGVLALLLGAFGLLHFGFGF